MYSYKYRVIVEVAHPTSNLKEALDLIDKEPCTYVKKGDERYTNKGRTLGRKASMTHLSWCLHEHPVNSSDEDPLVSLLGRWIPTLNNQKERIDALIREGASVRVEVALRPDESYSVLRLPPDIMNALSKAGVSLDVCIIVPPGELI